MNTPIYNSTNYERTMRDMATLVIHKFRNYLTEKGYKFQVITLPYGALPPNRNYLNTVIVVKNPDASLKSLLKKYNLEYNHRRNYYYRNEWTDSSLSLDMSIQIHTYNDIYNVNMLLSKEN